MIRCFISRSMYWIPICKVNQISSRLSCSSVILLRIVQNCLVWIIWLCCYGTAIKWLEWLPRTIETLSPYDKFVKCPKRILRYLLINGHLIEELFRVHLPSIFLANKFRKDSYSSISFYLQVYFAKHIHNSFFQLMIFHKIFQSPLNKISFTIKIKRKLNKTD